MQKRHGFTLAEFSLILIIIGLIAGILLFARDLFNAAALRAQVNQIEKYDAAVFTFKMKYNGLPGDILAAQASAFGLAARTGAPGHGNGNGALENCNGVSHDTIYRLGCEDALFWNDLGATGLLDDTYASDVDSQSLFSDITFTLSQAKQYLPLAKIGGGNSVSVFSLGGYENMNPVICGQGNFCYAIFANASQTNAGYQGQAGISPLQALALDTKLDDGIPNSGKVQGSNTSYYRGALIINTGGVYGTNNTITGACLISSSDDAYAYNVSSTVDANQPECLLNIAHK